MGLKDLGKLVKLKIISGGETFEVMFNPESFSERFSTVFKKRETVNSGLEVLDYVKSMPQDFKLKMVIDGTGATDFGIMRLPLIRSDTGSVYDQVNRFLKMSWLPEKGVPNRLEIRWGKFRFHCMLRDVTVNYTLFSREGLPLRAELDATFVGDNESNEKVYNQRFKSSSPSLGGASPARGGGESGGGPVNGIVIKVS